ncbi:hypothetical protein ABBQ32_009786 [Trebouxia sp. C0010 RCD-2024]
MIITTVMLPCEYLLRAEIATALSCSLQQLAVLLPWELIEVGCSLNPNPWASSGSGAVFCRQWAWGVADMLGAGNCELLHLWRLHAKDVIWTSPDCDAKFVWPSFAS